MIEPWKTLNASVGYDNPYTRILHERVALPDGHEIDYYLADRPDIALAFAVTEDNEVVLVRQYKHGAQAVTLELPGGALDKGEHPRDEAARELEEETGYVSPGAPVLIGSFHDDATKNRNTVHIVMFKDVRPTGRVALDKNESASGVEVVLLPIADVLSLVRAGEICAESSVAGIYRAVDAISTNKGIE